MGWQLHVPPLRFGALGIEDLAALVGLAGGLAGDPECSADVSPGRSLCAGGVDHQIRGVVEGFSGVSQPLEVLHGSLSASADRVQGGDAPTYPPACVGPGFGAHGGSVNRYFARSTMVDPGRTEMLVSDQPNSANCCKHSGPQMVINGAPSSGRALISSYISRRRHPNGSLPETTENVNDPREAATSGGRDHHDGKSVWRH